MGVRYWLNGWQFHLPYYVTWTQGYTTSRKIQGPSTNSWRQNGDKKQLPHGRPTVPEWRASLRLLLGPSARCMWADKHCCMWRGGPAIIVLKIAGASAPNLAARGLYTPALSSNRESPHPPMAQQPLVGQSFLIIEASRSHSDTTHLVGLHSSGRVISLTNRPVPDNTQHSRQTSTPAGEIRNSNPQYQ